MNINVLERWLKGCPRKFYVKGYTKGGELIVDETFDTEEEAYKKYEDLRKNDDSVFYAEFSKDYQMQRLIKSTTEEIEKEYEAAKQIELFGGE